MSNTLDKIGNRKFAKCHKRYHKKSKILCRFYWTKIICTNVYTVYTQQDNRDIGRRLIVTSATTSTIFYCFSAIAQSFCSFVIPAKSNLVQGEKEQVQRHRGNLIK